MISTDCGSPHLVGPGFFEPELVVDVELGPAAVREHHALDVELGGPGERALVLGIAVGDVVAPALAHLLEEGGVLLEVLPGRAVGELHPVAVLGLEVLAELLEQVLAVEGAGDRAVVGEGDDPAWLVVHAAGGEEVLEPRLLAHPVGVLRQRVVAGVLGQVLVEVGEGAPIGLSCT